MTSRPFVDPFLRLERMPAVLEKILDYLDDKSLCKLHQVCKRWNEAINRSCAWDRKLQYKTTSNIVWKEISQQLSEEHTQYEGKDCPAKEKYASIFLAAQKLEKNWRNGCARVNIVSLDDEEDFFEHTAVEYCSLLLTMDAKSVVVGFPSGTIKIFDRKSFRHFKEFFHEEGLQYVKFVNDGILLSASFLLIKLWNVQSGQLLKMVVEVPGKSDSPKNRVVFDSGHGLLVSWKQWANISPAGRVVGPIDNRISIWKLQSSKHDGKATAEMQLAHRETLPSSSFDATRLFVSEKYIVTVFRRQLLKAMEKYEMFIQVRSAADFNLIYSFAKERLQVFWVFSFDNDIISLQSTVNDERVTKIKVYDCNKKSSMDLSFKPQEFSTNIIANSNSRVFVGYDCALLSQNNGQSYEKGQHLEKNYSISHFELASVSFIESINLNDNNPSQSFTMDELSILQLWRKENPKTRLIEMKLVLIDFLELPGCSRSSCCLHCEKWTREPKRCGRCRRVHYCSVECQRSDWLRHKLLCSFS